MASSRFFHVFLAVSDMERSKEFYSKAFEGSGVIYEFAIDGHPLCMFSLGNGIVLEMADIPVKTYSEGKWGHIAIECDDIMEQYQRLIDAGATIKMPMETDTVLKGINGYPDSPCCGVHVLGPDGEEIELCQHRGAWGWDQPGTACPAYKG